MRYREIPGTGLNISELAFGTGDNAGLMVSGSPAARLEAASVALERGINYFDTSPDYGLGQSEENLVLNVQVGRDFVVSTHPEQAPLRANSRWRC